MELSKEQLILLRYIHNTIENTELPSYFTYKYNLNTSECIDKFWENGLIEYAAADLVVSHYSVQQIKNMLSEHDLPISGKKSILIERLLSNVDITALTEKSNKYIVLSKKGQKLLNDELSDEDYFNRNIVEHHIPTYEERLQKSIAEITLLKQSPIRWAYTIKTMKDGAVCEHCKAFEEKTFDIADAIPGENYPPFKGCTCDNCRCYASHDIIQ